MQLCVTEAAAETPLKLKSFKFFCLLKVFCSNFSSLGSLLLSFQLLSLFMFYENVCLWIFYWAKERRHGVRWWWPPPPSCSRFLNPSLLVTSVTPRPAASVCVLESTGNESSSSRQGTPDKGLHASPPSTKLLDDTATSLVNVCFLCLQK